MGVIGAVMIIQQLALKRDSMNVSLHLSAASQGLSQPDSTLPPARRRQVNTAAVKLFIC